MGIFSAQAQQIESGEYFLNSHRYDFRKMDTTGITPGASGSNVTWNFTGLVETGGPYNITFTDTSQFQFSPDFLNSTSVSHDSLRLHYYYRRKTTDSLIVSGIVQRTAEIKWKYSDEEIELLFPFQYLDTFSDSFKAQQSHADFAHSGEPAYRCGFSTVTADAWGTLMLPGSISIDSVLRVRVQRTTHDSTCIFCSINFFRIDDIVEDRYLFIKPGFAYPLLQINDIHTTINYLIENRVKEVLLTDTTFSIISGTTPSMLSQNIELWPNPADKLLFFRSNITQKHTIEILDVFGRRIFSAFEITEPETAIDLSQFAAGPYILRCISDEEMVTKPFIIR